MVWKIYVWAPFRLLLIIWTKLKAIIVLIHWVTRWTHYKSDKTTLVKIVNFGGIAWPISWTELVWKALPTHTMKYFKNRSKMVIAALDILNENCQKTINTSKIFNWLEKCGVSGAQSLSDSDDHSGSSIVPCATISVIYTYINFLNKAIYTIALHYTCLHVYTWLYTCFSLVVLVLLSSSDTGLVGIIVLVKIVTAGVSSWSHRRKWFKSNVRCVYNS